MSESLSGRVLATHSAIDRDFVEVEEWVMTRQEIANEVATINAKLAAAESALASLADMINLELRESGQFSMQAELGDDLRPFVRRLVDANRRSGR